jgi:hypothetical protein
MRLPTLAVLVVVLSLAVPLRSPAAPSGDANGDHRVSVADGVRASRAAAGLGRCAQGRCDADGNGTVTADDARAIVRRAAGLGSATTTSPAPAAPRAPATTPVAVRFTFQATAALEGFQIEVAYPLAKGGFSGSADAVACTSNGDGFFIANDRDDGTMLLSQVHFMPLSFPMAIVCRFDQNPGEALAAADIGVTVREVVENEAPGDPTDLQTEVSLAEVSPICDAGAVTFTAKPGSMIDTGWTGIYHRQDLPHDAALALPLTCDPGTGSCAIAGDALPDTTVGPPVPLSAGGVPICVLSTFRETPTGSYDCGTGCSELTLPLLVRTFLDPEVASPCPTCVGDLTPNDGVKSGTCNGGSTPGASCDVGGITDRFAATGVDAASTSNDCLPTGSSVGELAIDLSPLTTGTTSLTASFDCRSPDFPETKCHCANQVQPNSCFDGICPASGVCESGPIDGICSNQRFRFCRPESGTEDCEDIFPGSGTCVSEPRPCFPSTIERIGACGTADAILTSVFCVPNTRAAAINTVMGLPGPAAVSVPVHVAPGTPPPPAGACSAIPRSGCRTIASNKTSVLQLEASGRSSELTWRWLGGDATPASAFGDPTIDTDYALCAYAPTLVLEATAEAGTLCNGKPCWRSTPDTGFVYKDPSGTSAGLTRIDLSPGATGKARITVKGKGTTLPLPPLPLATPPLVQLQSNNGECWETTFTAADIRHNDATKFRAARP